MSNEIEVKNQSMLATQSEAPMGFEDEDEDDVIVPRIKIVNALSPERKEKLADEGDIINSLTKEKYTGKVFIPVFKFTNVIKWKDRADGGGIEAISRDGKIMVPMDGGAPYPVGKLAEFDNSKQGKDAIPTHVKYMNFFGFFEGERMPIVLSFAKTNYAEGKKLFSLAKVQMQNMWNFGYALNPKAMSKAGNDWFNISVAPAGPTSEEDREFALNVYQMFKGKMDFAFDMDNEGGADPTSPAVDQTAAEEAEF